MSAEKLDVHPTRLELLRLRRRKTLAEGIADILQKDLETLIMTLIEYSQRARVLRKELNESLDRAYHLFTEAEMIAGSMKVREMSLSAQHTEFDVHVGTTPGVLGIHFPSLQVIKVDNGSPKPRFNILETPIQLEDAASRTKETLNSIVKLAELTAVVREILEVIALKRRQINKIRFKIVPQLETTIRYIELILEEVERQDAIRVRVLQRKRKERATKPI